ncbi:uncharacterized protein V1518DRAFT_409967 [Limtongia smithiae]|uniref:uncharacterized protein n=1 Tax=Limtongia smithiae TaxID=1125753 RepID=UPI0034CD7ED0
MSSAPGKASKRKGHFSDDSKRDKKSKKINYWKSASSTIHPGVSGIFVTCNRNHEKQCAQELMDLFNEEAEKQINFDDVAADDEEYDVKKNKEDVEAAVMKELAGLSKTKDKNLFTPVNIDCECVLFFRTKKPVDPTSFVHALCTHALESGTKSTRHTLRLSPVALTAPATAEDLIALTNKIIPLYFGGHKDDDSAPSFKFAIRPTIRNHNTLTREQVIQLVAANVGSRHSVDLTSYDRLIIIECFKNIVGMSVVPGDFEKLKRFNLQQIFESTEAAKDATSE